MARLPKDRLTISGLSLTTEGLCRPNSAAFSPVSGVIYLPPIESD